MNPKTSIPDIQILSIHAYLKLYQNVVLPDIILLMKNIFNFRNLGIYSLIYTIVTLAVSIFKLTNGINYDPLGYWHDIDRAFVLFIIFVAVLTIKYFRFSKYIGNILSQLLPLILSILAYLFLLYLRDIVSPDIFKKLLFYSLVFFIAFFLLKWLFNTIFNLIDSLSRSKALNRMRIELWGLLYFKVRLTRIELAYTKLKVWCHTFRRQAQIIGTLGIKYCVENSNKMS